MDIQLIGDESIVTPQALKLATSNCLFSTKTLEPGPRGLKDLRDGLVILKTSAFIYQVRRL